MSRAARTPVDPARRALLAKVHIARKELGLDEEAYRGLLEAAGGRRSAAELDNAQLAAVLDTFRAKGWSGERRAAPRPGPRARDEAEAHRRKVRALWWCLWHLGCLSEGSEKALDAFVKRQTGVEKLAWLPADRAAPVIDALKDWAARPADRRGGGVNWGAHYSPRVCVALAQWRRLQALGQVRLGGLAGLDAWIASKGGPEHFEALEARAADETIRRLGAWLRRELAARGGAGGSRGDAETRREEP